MYFYEFIWIFWLVPKFYFLQMSSHKKTGCATALTTMRLESLIGGTPKLEFTVRSYDRSLEREKSRKWVRKSDFLQTMSYEDEACTFA